MRNKILLLALVICLLWSGPAAADGDVIIDLQGVVKYDGDGYAVVDAGGGDNAPLTGAVHLDDGLWIEAGATNLITNPSFETNTTGWVTSGLTVTRDTVYQYVGNASAKLTGTGGTYYLRSGYMPVAAGITYTLQAMIAKVAGTGTGNLSIRWYDASYTYLLINACSFDATLHTWRRYDCTHAAPATAVWAYVMIRFSGMSDSVELYADALSFSHGLPTTYGDGDHGPGYSWTGAAHASTSERLTTTITMPPYALNALDGTDAYSLRIRYTPQYSSTADWPDSAVLFDLRGVTDNQRVTVSYEDADDKYHIYLNGADRFQTSARTFAAGEERDLWIGLDFDDMARVIENGAIIAEYTMALTPPAGILTATVGSDVYGTNHANALFHEFGATDGLITLSQATLAMGDYLMLPPLNPNPSVYLLEDLMAYYPLDEHSGVRYDAHGSYDLTDNNTVGYTATGVISNAAHLNAASDEYLNVNNAGSITPDIYTWAGWFRLENISTTHGLLAIRDYSLTYTPTHHTIAIRTNSGDSFLLPTVITDTGWHHMIMWYLPGDLAFRLDGDQTYFIPHTPPYAHESIHNLGRYGTAYLTGDLDEWGRWERVLYESEMDALYNAGDGLAYAEFERSPLGTPTPTPTITPTPTATPTPTPEYIPYGDSKPEKLYFPYVIKQYNPNNPTDGDSPISLIPVDYEGDVTWYDWATTIAGWFDPLFGAIIDARAGLETMRSDTCSSELAPFLSGGDYTSIDALTSLGDNPQIVDVAYSIGWAIGAPIAWLRGVLSFLSAMDVNYLVALIYFMIAGAIWIGFVAVVSYSARFVRAAIDWIIKVYELIPAKST